MIEIKNVDCLEGIKELADGSVGKAITHAHLGFSLKALPMAAYAYGQIEKDQKSEISKLLNG